MMRWADSEEFETIMGDNRLSFDVIRNAVRTAVWKAISDHAKNLFKESLAEDTQFHQVKHILLSRVEIEDDGNVMKSLCRTIAKAFIVFGGENGWPDLFPYILYFLENQTNDEIRATLNKIPLAEDTQIQVKHIFLSRVLTEDDGNVRISLCRTIANAFTVFGGENGWPELSVFINQCVEVDNDLLKETAMLILANLLEQSTNVATRDESTFILEMLLGLLIHKPLDDRTSNVFGGENGWQELSDFIHRCSLGPNVVLREATMLISGSLQQNII
ncbi:importin-5-like protein isoform X1 [Tanacetum coccineum]|uniref:Importin-5-like protein isoform X1 n=1 Tax=Tanacetum coccineum TaxID=301880 RepID=A0ABQ5APC3_9ASTR